MSAVAMVEETTSLSLVAAARALRDALSGFEPALVSGHDAARAVKELALTEKVCAAARVRAASRAAECGAHREAGFSRPTEWMARATGTTAGLARRDLELAARLDDHPETKAALAQGEISLGEADEVVKTEQACPGTEHEMLGVVRRRGLRAARERGKRIRQGAIDVEELERRRLEARELRTWTDELGMVCLSARMLPVVGARFLSRLEAETEREWRRGNRESSYEQRAHDAFVAMVEGQGRGSTTRPELVAVWNLNDDTAHIPVVGPISTKSVRDLAKDAVVSVVLHDGVKVERIVRYSRNIPRVLGTLLEIGDPPDFEGAKCVDCGGRFRWQRDHVDPLAHGGPTSLENLTPRCPPCHEAKTKRDREAGLLGGKSKREGRGPP